MSADGRRRKWANR